jgi:glycosyltransferase involved in cell wall biosynthesis
LARRDIVVRDGVGIAQVVPLLNARPAPLRQLLYASVVRQLAVRLAAAQLARLTPSDPTSQRPIVVNSNVYLADAASSLRPSLTVLDICDDPRHYPGEPPWTHKLLVNAVRRADLVTTSSRWLESEFRDLGAQRVEYVPNGIPEEHLQGDVATERRPIGTAPVVGFVGHFGPWVDLELLDQVAEAMPQARVVLAGNVDPAVRATFAGLLRRANVEYRGFVAHNRVPAIIAEFDVGLIPFRASSYTRAVNPVKLYEYAAHNVPVVSTAFSPDIVTFRGYVDVCDRSSDFVKAVCQRSRLGHDVDIRWIAKEHTWQALSHQLVMHVARSSDTRNVASSQSGYEVA